MSALAGALMKRGQDVRAPARQLSASSGLSATIRLNHFQPLANHSNLARLYGNLAGKLVIQSRLIASIE